MLGLGAGECVGRGRGREGGRGKQWEGEGDSGRGREAERGRETEGVNTYLLSGKRIYMWRVPFLDGDVEEVDEPGERYHCTFVHSVCRISIQ